MRGGTNWVAYSMSLDCHKAKSTFKFDVPASMSMPRSESTSGKQEMTAHSLGQMLISPWFPVSALFLHISVGRFGIV